MFILPHKNVNGIMRSKVLLTLFKLLQTKTFVYILSLCGFNTFKFLPPFMGTAAFYQNNLATGCALRWYMLMGV